MVLPIRSNEILNRLTFAIAVPLEGRPGGGAPPRIRGWDMVVEPERSLIRVERRSRLSIELISARIAHPVYGHLFRVRMQRLL